MPIKPTLEKYGYPFKSKEHSAVVGSYQNGNKEGQWVTRYLTRGGMHGCPPKFMYQFTDECTLKISDKCCDKMKKEPLHKWQKENNKTVAIIGIMASEGGRRSSAKCLVFTDDKLKSFQPLSPMTKEWEDWFIETYNIEICEIYKPPYNFDRTGCKGCPFAMNIQNELDTLEHFFPEERKQCEFIWKPVYDEYRRLNYRLKQNCQLSFEDSWRWTEEDE